MMSNLAHCIHFFTFLRSVSQMIYDSFIYIIVIIIIITIIIAIIIIIIDLLLLIFVIIAVMAIVMVIIITIIIIIIIIIITITIIIIIIKSKTTLPIVLNRDLSLIQDPIKLHSSKDLAEITELAQDRKCWRELTSRIEKAAEVPQTKNWDPKRQ